ncbi:MAG: hypothetical protein Hyperionvirus3_8 [Hyperionvirus sp.]|uniref:Leucine-rich repeat protein n=1 Tax=Hyperionvirus sp. TaxID=2487770 RepID=A0A3G5A749_9VIRU|nr:MAG: hypothetical protein Hyperionvirus3_8 [Hyperionvirus sp.]
MRNGGDVIVFDALWPFLNIGQLHLMSQTCRRAKSELRNKAQPRVRINNLEDGLSLMRSFLKVKLIIRNQVYGTIPCSPERLSKLTRVSELSFRCLADEPLELNVYSIRDLINLEWLEMHRYVFEGGDLIFLTKLTHLSLFSNPIRGAALPLMANLTWLDIADCGYVDDDSLRNFPNLIHLGIGWEDNIITNKGLLHFPGLRSLDVFGNEHVTSAGILTLTRLQILRVGSPQVDGSFSRLTSLTKLEIFGSSHQITESDIENMLGLEALVFDYNELITSNPVAKLVSLRELTLKSTMRDIFDLRALGSLSKLQRLVLWNTDITFENVRCLQDLTSLDVRGNSGFEGVNLFEHFPKLRTLEKN